MRKIVLIEDDVMLSQNLIEILEEENFNIIHATNGKTGIELVKTHLPDIIISDILISGCSGIEIKETLNEDPLVSTIPFIFLTAKADKYDIRRGMEVGADDYLVKPVSREELINSINSRIRKSEIFKKHSSDLTKSIALALPHEFNNPLISILGYSEIILEIAGKGEHCQCSDIVGYIKAIHSSGADLLQLLKRFLLVVKLEMIFSDVNEVKKYNEQKTKFLSADIAEAFIIDYTEKFEDMQSIIKNNVSSVRLNISDEDFEIILKEIIENAFKFSDEDSPVQILLNVTDDFYIIEVKNAGRGMTEEQIARVGMFQQFEREKYEQRGMGLGLAIAKRLIELNEGELQISSIPEVETIVKLFIPLR